MILADFPIQLRLGPAISVKGVIRKSLTTLFIFKILLIKQGTDHVLLLFFLTFQH